MSATLYRKLGELFWDNSGNLLAAGYLYFYQAGTSILQATYSDENATIPNTNPIQLDANGRLETPVFLGSTYDYKELVTDVNGATISPWPFDNIPMSPAVISSSNFAYRLLPWTTITSAQSPYSPAASAAGNGYRCDTAGGAITINLPSAAAVGNGKGFAYKNITSAHTVTIVCAGVELCDGVGTVTLTQAWEEIEIISGGAGWNIASHVDPGGWLPGDTKSTKRTDTQAGWLYCDGTAVLIATYPDLTTAVYCGNSDNAGATECYKCTNPANPNGSRSTAGTYLTLPDMRGYFQRGWDDSRGVDSARDMSTSQDDQLQDHKHSYDKAQLGISGSAGGDGVFLNVAFAATDTGNPDSGNHGSETRVKNLAYRFLIKT